jgi:glycerol-3-phosphate dehydrogenase
VVHAAREEMAVHLADVVLRRTDLGSEMRPPEAALEAAADLMARSLGWSPARRDAEISDIREIYP